MVCDLQTMFKIRIGILFVEGGDMTPEADPLGQLPQFVLSELGVEFRLTGEDNLDQLVSARLR